MKSSSTWKLVYDNFEPEQEGLREALCTLGNGYFATRGAIPEALASNIHYPGTYMAGVYNRLETHIAGRTVSHENIVNCPNWIFLTFKIGNGEWFYPSISGILSYHQELDMRKGILARRIRFKNRKGQRTLIETSRIVHMADPHFGAMRYVITPENYSEWIKVRTMLDGTVQNAGVERYRQLSSKHWKPCSSGEFGKSGIFLSMKTNQSNIEVDEAARIRIFLGQREIRPSIECLKKGEGRIGQEFKIFAKKKEPCKIEKVVSFYSSKDKGIQNPARAAVEYAQNARRLSALIKTHQQAWERLWKRFDIQIKGDDFAQRALRLHMFHLLQSASLHNIKLDVGLPARGLHGEAYGGHIFWDQLFIMSFYNLRIPEISKALLLYRYRRLPRARENAEREGYRGAMFPWQSVTSGREETQAVHLNPMSGIWGPDYSSLQRHVSFAVAYNVWQYWRSTADFDFLLDYGTEIILSIAQLGASLAKYDSSDGRYHTEGLMGPDEFHERLSGSAKPGLKDNAYTNLMIVWTLLKAQKILSILPEDRKAQILKKLKLTQKDFTLWDDITHKMNIIINSEGIISQFDGYFRLKELDWNKYRAKYKNIQRMDRILKAEGESPDDYKVSKQADALMFFYLVPFSEIEDIFRRLGYNFERSMLRKNFEYYVKRTSHGSTLSKVICCFIAHLLGGTKESWQWFHEVLESDIFDAQGGTTSEGIHTGLMGGSIDIALRAFAGISTLENIIKINPNLPKNWQRVKLRLHYRERWFSLTITKNQVTILIQGPATKFFTIPVEISGRVYFLLLGKTYGIPLKKKQRQ